MKKITIIMLIIAILGLSACSSETPPANTTLNKNIETSESVHNGSNSEDDNEVLNNNPNKENKQNPETVTGGAPLNETVDTGSALIGSPSEIQIVNAQGIFELSNQSEKILTSIIGSMPAQLDEYKSLYEEDQIIARLIYDEPRSTEIMLSDGTIAVSFDSIEISNDGMMFLIPQGTALGKIHNVETILN